MANPLDGFARYLEAAGHLRYTPDGTSGDCFIGMMPPSPDEAVALTLYGGPEPDSKLGYDAPNLQVRVRGTSDPRVSWDRCENIRSELHGLEHSTLPDGTYLVLCVAAQAVPAPMGTDANSRHEHVVNFRTEIRSVTKHRI